MKDKHVHKQISKCFNFLYKKKINSSKNNKKITVLQVSEIQTLNQLGLLNKTTD